jgi:hypothetical protein
MDEAGMEERIGLKMVRHLFCFWDVVNRKIPLEESSDVVGDGRGGL